MSTMWCDRDPSHQGGLRFTFCILVYFFQQAIHFLEFIGVIGFFRVFLDLYFYLLTFSWELISFTEVVTDITTLFVPQEMFLRIIDVLT